MEKLTIEDKERIKKFRNLYEKTIEVNVSFCEEGGYCAKIVTYPGCVTEAETLSELVEMVNDAILTMLEVPRKYISYMPTYSPPVSLFQKFNLFPVDVDKIINQSVEFSIK